MSEFKGVTKYDKAVAGAIGAAVAELVGHYLDWPPGLAATVAGGLTGLIVMRWPNRGAVYLGDEGEKT